MEKAFCQTPPLPCQKENTYAILLASSRRSILLNTSEIKYFIKNENKYMTKMIV